VHGTASGPLYSERGPSGSGPWLGGFGGKGTDMATSVWWGRAQYSKHLQQRPPDSPRFHGGRR